jgi:Coenzyme PQQ synthesis protein D (PqqD)
MKQDILPLARQNEIVVQNSNNEVLIYDLKTNKVWCLNETSAAIWQLCNGKNDVDSIANHLKLQTNQQIPLELVEIALEKLSDENLIENYQSQIIPTNKKSRREIIRKIGLATAIALPIVSSLIAPSSVAAASCSAGETYCPVSSLGFIVSPEGCKNLQIGTPVILTSFGEARQCGGCHLFCLSSPGFLMDCVGGVCVPV